MAMRFCNPPDRSRVVSVSRASYQAPLPGPGDASHMPGSPLM